MTCCKPCQANRIKNIIQKVRTLKAIEYFEKEGDLYLKTFLISDKRNKNGWRASWTSIKKNHKSFHGRPGIEYVKCGSKGCMRDHTDASSYDENIHVQEKYRVTTIVDTVLDEAAHTAYAIHKVLSKEFAEKVKRKEIRYLSPSIWPNREKTNLYQVDDDEWYIDTTDWDGLHDAFVDDPAFDHAARIVGQCIGNEECVTSLKKDKTLVAKSLLAMAKAYL